LRALSGLARVGCLPGLRTKSAELFPGLVGVGVVQVIEDGQGLPPDLPRLLRVGGGDGGVAKAGE